jgi:CRP-like cAMP-binding protein
MILAHEETMADQVNMAYGVEGVKKYYSIGDTIASMGDPANGFYILLNGKIGVFKKDFTVAEVNERGTIFGELGCILNIPRTATLQALEPTTVLFVQMTIEEIVARHPQFAKRLLVDLADRLTRTTESCAERNPIFFSTFPTVHDPSGRPPA